MKYFMNGYFFPKTLAKIANDKFLSNSFIFFAGSMLISFGNYLFHFLMARMLPIEGYGELQSLIAISAIFGIPMGALSIILVKYTALFKAKEQLNKVYSLLSIFTKKILLITAVFFILFIFFSKYIANFLNILSVIPVVILGCSFLPGFLGTCNNGIIQGLQKFKSASIIGTIGVVSKILLAVLLVKLSFGLNGALGAMVLSGFIGYFLAFLPLKFLFGREKQEVETKQIFQYFFPVFFTLFFVTLLYNIDIVLVKHFLSPRAAGEYGALALIGHIVFFLGGPIVGVMFPMAVTAQANHQDPSKVFKKTIFLVSLIGLVVLGVYFLLPNFVIKILVGSKFLSISKFLGWFGVSMFFYSLISLFSQYFLSIHKTKFFWLVGIGVLAQTMLISIWHQNLWQIIWIMNITMLSTLVLLVIYYLISCKAATVTKPVFERFSVKG